MKKKAILIAAVVLAAFLVMVPAVSAMVQPGDISVSTTPSDATVTLYRSQDSGSTYSFYESAMTPHVFQTLPAESYDKYKVVISKSGYETTTDYVSGTEIGGGGLVTITKALQPTPSYGYLYVESSPSGYVYVDGTSYGKSPITATLSPGAYNVRVVLNGYNTWSKTVTISSDNTTKIYPSLTPETTYGYVAVSSNPNYSNVYVDGIYKGQTPLTVTLSTGNHTLKLTKSGYTGFTKTITVYEGVTSSVYGVLSKEETNAYINISSTPAGASVYVDGEYIGTTPSSGVLSQTVSANETHTLRVSASGYDSYSTSFNLVTGEIKLFSPVLTVSQPTTAFVNITSVPSGASVYIDSVYVGSTPIAQSVTAGTHTIKLACLGYNDYTTTMNFTGGQSVNLPITMTPTSTPASSPFPVLGILIGLGAAAVFAGRKLRR